MLRLAEFRLDDSSIPRTRVSRPLRHVPSETSWSASSVNSGSMAFGSLASRASTYFWTTARTVLSSPDWAAGSPATRGIGGSIRIRAKCGRTRRRMADTPCVRPGSVPSHLPPSYRPGTGHPIRAPAALAGARCVWHNEQGGFAVCESGGDDEGWSLPGGEVLMAITYEDAV